MNLSNRSLLNFRSIFRNEYRELILLIVLQTLTIVLWFREGIPLQFAESGLYLYSSKYLLLYTCYSYSDFGLGGPNFQLQSYGLGLFIYILRDKLSLPLYVVELIIFCASTISATLGVYFLTSFLINEKKAECKSTAGFFASLFYLLNPYALMVIWNRFQLPFIIFYGFMPLCLMLYLKGLISRRLENLIYVIITSYFLAPSFAVFSFILSYHFFIFFITGLFSLLSFQSNRDLLKFSVLYFLCFEVLWLLTNLWWVLPEAVMLMQVNFNVSYVYNSYYITQFLSKALGSLLNAFRIFYKSYFLTRNSLFSFDFFSPTYDFLSIVIPVIIFSPLIFSKRFLSEKIRVPLLLTFVIMAVAFIFLSKGLLPPLGELYNILMNLKLFVVYRIPFEKFGIFVVLSYSILFGVSISLLIDIVNSKFFKKLFLKRLLLLLTVGLSLILCAFPGKPIIDASVFHNISYPSNSETIGYKAILPVYYSVAFKTINPDPSKYRVLFLPIRRYGGQVSYNWDYGYFGLDVPLQTFNGQTISYILFSSYLPQTDDLIIMLEDAIMQNSSSAYLFLSILNVKYIVVQHDLSYPLPCKYSPKEVESTLNRSKFVSFLNKIGNLTLYEVNNSIFFERIYAASNILNNTIYLSENYSKLTFRRLYPGLYEVKFEELPKFPFVLVLSELYHPGWMLVKSDSNLVLQSFFKDQKPLVKHVLVNGYANGWLFDNSSSEVSDNKEVKFFLLFQPQVFEDIGLLITLVTWLSLIVLFVISKVKWLNFNSFNIDKNFSVVIRQKMNIL